MRNRQLTLSLLAVLVLLLAACGGPGNPEPADPEPAGAALYAQACVGCHGPEGGGLSGPALAGNLKLAATAAVIDRVLAGAVGMPAYRERMSDAEIAAVLSHVRSSWGNSFGAVDAQQVAERRAAE